MLLLSQLQILSAPLEMVIDSILLTIFIVPVLYLFLFRPMITNINDRLRAEDDLKKAKSGLEVKIQERTEELNKSNEQLKLEIIERREIEKETVAAKVRLEHLLESTPVVIYSCKIDGDKFVPTFASSSLKNFLGYDVSDFTRNPNWWVEKLHPEDRARIFTEFPARFFENGRLDHEYRFQAQDGTYRWIHDRVRLVRDKDGQPAEIVGSWLDITDRKEYESTIMQLAYYDSLTSLPNRRMFIDTFSKTIARMKRQGLLAAILYLDLNRFKVINDTLGHSAGDQLLKEVAVKLSQCVRLSDTLARFGGDEFIILLSEISRIEDIVKVVERVFLSLDLPIKLNEHEVTVSTSIGISIFPDDGDDIETLLKKADVAMYRAKSNKKNSYQFYASNINISSIEWLKLEHELRRAVEKKEFLLYYQPQIDIDTCKISGIEALLRWNNPEKGMINPGKFITLAEDTGLIIPIGEWVIYESCRQGKIWQEKGLNPVVISVNVSKLQFKQKDFVNTVKKILKETGIPTGLLQLEITESIIMDNTDVIIGALDELKGIGVALAIDDFGIGYSSLGYLKHMPIDVLKIDQSFVRDMSIDKNDAAICKAVIGIANSLNMDVIAEGVETIEQLNMLHNLTCKKIQGYLISKPVPAGDFEQFLNKDWRFTTDQPLLNTFSEGPFASIKP